MATPELGPPLAAVSPASHWGEAQILGDFCVEAAEQSASSASLLSGATTPREWFSAAALEVAKCVGGLQLQAPTSSTQVSTRPLAGTMWPGAEAVVPE